MTVLMSPERSRCGIWLKVYWLAPEARVNTQMTSKRSPGHACGIIVPATAGERRGQRRDVVMLPANEHHTAILADHVGGERRFVAFGVGGDDGHAEADAQALNRLVGPVVGGLVRAAIGGREQRSGGVQPGLERTRGGVKEGGQCTRALPAPGQQGMRILVSLEVDAERRPARSSILPGRCGGRISCFSPWRII